MFQSFLPGRRGQSLRGTNEIAELAARPVDKRRSCRRRNGAALGTAGERRVRSLSLPDRGDLPQRRLAGASLYFDVSGLSTLCGRSPSAYSNPTKGYCVLIGFGRMAKGVNVKAAVRMATCGAPRPVTSCYSTSLSPGCRPYPHAVAPPSRPVRRPCAAPRRLPSGVGTDCPFRFQPADWRPLAMPGPGHLV